MNISLPAEKEAGQQRVRIDMAGKQYGHLQCLRFSHLDPKKNAHWVFRCYCGVEKSANGADVRAGKVKSCGHLKVQTGAANQLKHGHAKRGNRTSTYRAWRNMINRCYEPSCERFKNYGARGIRVCDRWRHDYQAFLMDMGERPAGLTLERRNVHGDYSPENCVWATWDEQRANTTRSLKNRI